MKAITIHLMLADLKTAFRDKVTPQLQRKFFFENPALDMKDCGSLIREIANKYNINEKIALQLAKDEMEKEADTIIDFAIREKIILGQLSQQELMEYKLVPK